MLFVKKEISFASYATRLIASIVAKVKKIEAQEVNTISTLDICEFEVHVKAAISELADRYGRRFYKL